MTYRSTNDQPVNRLSRAITVGAVLKYAFLPRIFPRVRNLFGSGFASFALFIALVYRAVRLLPDGHPYLNPQNMGRFGVLDVISEAFRHIKFNRSILKQNNIDQIVVFVVVAAAILLLAFQLVMMVMVLLFPSAMAFSFPGGLSFSSPFQMFDTPRIQGNTLVQMGSNGQSFYDLSFIFLDRVFGVPNVFGSCIADGQLNSCKPIKPMYGAGSGGAINDPAGFPWPYHIALQGIFQFYSVGLLIIAIFLLIYYTIVVAVETAQTGVPFGKRFNTVWVPLRLVAAAGLLIPLTYGLNSGQYIVLYAAKYGANFASNGWIGFNQTLVAANAGGTPLGDKANMMAKPAIPNAMELIHFISVMHACKTMEDKVLQQKIVGNLDPDLITPYLVRSSESPKFMKLTDSVTYDDAVKFSKLGDVVISFGMQDDKMFKSKLGTVDPVCGQLTISTVVVPEGAISNGTNGSPGLAFKHQGAQQIGRLYWDLLRYLALKRDEGQGLPSVFVDPSTSSGTNSPATSPTLPWNINTKISNPYVANYMMYTKDGLKFSEPLPADKQELILYVQSSLETAIRAGQVTESDNASNPYALPADLLVRGWAAAGIWYNRIADMNGTFTTAAGNLPKVSMYPQTMRYLAEQKAKTQQASNASTTFDPYIQNGAGQSPFTIVYSRGADEDRAADAYWEITKFWQDGTGFSTSTRGVSTGNPIIDVINFLFSTSGLFSIRENANVHPLAQLSSIGKSLVERSVSMLGMGLVATGIQPWVPENLAGLRSALGVVSSFIFSILSIGASAGFILYYIIPFLPFIYFFFAVGGWVKAIFEAMVGVPLWALAHIRIDGDGFTGEAAKNGYFMILEIMVRPILIVFGLVASVTIFAASVQVLNDIFNLAVDNVGGVNMDKILMNPTVSLESVRSSIDAFFYTIVYVILVYMIGMSSFKLIDLIPSSMLRWMGVSIQAFNDPGEAYAGQLTSYGTMGSQMAFSTLGGAAQKGVSGLSQAAKGLKDSAGGTKP